MFNNSIFKKFISYGFIPVLTYIIYYVSSNGFGTAKLYKSNLDGTSPTLLFSSSAGSNDLDSIAANDSYIWYGIDNDGLYRANTDGSDV